MSGIWFRKAKNWRTTITTTTMSELLIVHIVVAVITMIPSIIVIFKVKEIHVSLNSRLTELVRLTRAEGVAEGKQFTHNGEE